ncbi:MAG: hypothetical protein GY913_32055 [Proteobacteria bacterium]|nr:hypothetical protein [Pseudomonadota bacterium]MCP4921555.1 hypothetical protein [Pseudomonadota bacterium]
MLDALLSRFEGLANGPVSWSFQHDGGGLDTHVVFGSMIHGNETGSLPAVVELAEDLSSGAVQFGGRVSLFIGNVEAARADRRFLEADLNRVFIDSDVDTHEHRRARELRRILDEADVFIDLHQTILPTEQPFYIFPWTAKGGDWARGLAAARVWVTRPSGESFSSGTCCADEYVRNRGHIGLTVELGQKGFSPSAGQLASRVMRRALVMAETGDREGPELEFWRTTAKVPYSDRALRLRPGLTNFRPVRRGERLTADDAPTVVSPHDGVLLFPKYPPDDQPLPNEIVRVLTRMGQHPRTLWGQASSA